MVHIFNYINLDTQMIDFMGKKVIIYGRAVTALNVYKELIDKGVNVLGFVDSFSTEGETFAGEKVWSLNSIKNINNVIIYVAINEEKYKREILYLLEELHFENATIVMHGLVYGSWKYDIDEMISLVEKNKNTIDFVKSNMSDEKSKKVLDNILKYRLNGDRKLLEEIYEISHKQYFPGEEIIQIAPQETFVDVGGFDGLSTVDFVEWTKGEYKKSIILEADNVMYNICSEMMKIKKIEKFELIKKAAYSESKTLKFDASDNLSGSGTISSDGSCEVEGITLDELLDKEIPTYIKMDIEGAEMDALFGCEETILQHHPKLAISIYHKVEDLWTIPKYLMEKYPFYKFYMRHYTPYTTETILYAVEE